MSRICSFGAKLRSVRQGNASILWIAKSVSQARNDGEEGGEDSLGR